VAAVMAAMAEVVAVLDLLLPTQLELLLLTLLVAMVVLEETLDNKRDMVLLQAKVVTVHKEFTMCFMLAMALAA
jgi:hypothetical protein